MVLYIGIDPGVSGGIAALDEHGTVHGTFKMPDTGRDLWDLLDEIESRWHHPPARVRAVIEKVNPGVFGKPGQRMGVVSAFTFGRNVERCHMALIAASIPFDEVLPVKWQTEMGCRTRGDKNVSKARAQQLFPTVKVTHAIADALLIAEFCRRMERGSLNREPAERGLFNGKEEEQQQVVKGVDFAKGKDRSVVVEALERGLAASVTQGRREGAPRRADQEARPAAAVARHGRRSR